MGAFDLLARVLNFGRTVPEDPQGAHSYYYWPGRTVAGVTITEDRALSLSVFNACIRVLSEDIAKLPWEVLAWQRTPRGREGSLGKMRAPDHPVERLLSASPNDDMTAFTLRQTLIADMLIFGNAYAEVERDLAGRAVALHHIEPERVDPMRDRDTHQLFYRVTNRQFGQVDLMPADIFHVPGFCRVAGFGMPAISYMAETVGEGIGMRDHISAFWANNATPNGILTTDTPLKDATFERLKSDWAEIHKGAKNSHKVAILEQGLKWQNTQGNNDTAQFIESRSFNVEDIIRFFRVPPHKISHLKDASYNNIAELSRSYAQDTIAPLIVKFEQEADRKLFGQNRQRFFTRINMDELTRGDMLTRYQAYHVARQDGWLNADEIRAKEDMNPIGGVEGTARWWPSNTVPADMAYEQQQIQRDDPVEPAPADQGDDLETPLLNITNVQNAFRHILVASSKSSFRREANWAKRRAKRNKTNWDEELREYLWGETSVAFCRRDFEPAVTGIATVVTMSADETAKKLDAIVEAHLQVSYSLLASGTPDPDNFDEKQAEAAVVGLFSFPNRLAA